MTEREELAGPGHTSVVDCPPYARATPCPDCGSRDTKRGGTRRAKFRYHWTCGCGMVWHYSRNGNVVEGV